MLSHSSQAQRDGEPSSASAAVQMGGLGNRFLGLLGRKWSRRAFAAEMAKLLAEAAGAKATAVLGYERRSGSLALLADHRLSDEARAALSGGADAWDIPLRGLQNRRISVIEAAHHNPFVPRALAQLCPTGLCIVSLPVYYDHDPVGVALLFTARSRAFPDGQLQTLSQALRVCGRGLRERESPIARISTAAVAPAVSPAEAAAEAAQEPTLRVLGGGQVEPIEERQPEAAVTEAQRVQRELARAQADMQRRSEAVRSVATATRVLRTERERLAQQLTESEYLRQSESDELRGQIAALEERLLAAESERLRYQRAAETKHQRTEESVQALQAERDALLERLRVAESSGSEAQAILNAARQEYEHLAAQKQAELEEAAATAAQLRQQLQDRAGALTTSDEQLVALRAQLERAGVERQQAERVFEEGLASARADIERLTADASGLRSQLEARDADLARLRDDSERAQQTQNTLHQSAVALREDVDRLTAQLEQTATTAAVRESELSAALAQARAEAETLRRASADRETLARTATDLGDRAASLEQLVASLREQVAQAQAEGTRGDQQAADLRAQLAAAQQTYEQARADAERERTELQTAVKAAEAAAQSATAETDELRHTVHDALQRLEEERLKHTAEIEALLEESALPLPAAATEVPTATPEEVQGGDEVEVEAPESPLVIERSAPLAAASDALTEAAESPEPPVEYPQSAASVEELVLLDQGATAEQACAALADAGFQVTLFPFGETTVDELARRKLKCIMLNLGAGAAAWRTLKLLRERAGTRNVPVLVYVMAPNATTGFCFGRTDFALWPLEPGRMIEHLGRLRPKLHRLLAVTSDVDGMSQLREPLARARISTSIVLDAKQVMDFAAMIDPEAALLHISPSCPSAARALAALRASDSTRELPLLVLLDKSAGDDDTFFSQASQQLLSKARFQFSRLPEEIGRLIG
jgi:colicin import membrane protein